jgi:TrmH family RNA methyltransferase
MGSLFNVEIYRTGLSGFLKENEQFFNLPVFAADMKGKTLDQVKMPEKMILIFGSESNGIPDELRLFIHDYIHIPSKGTPLSESLNAAMAASIMLHHFSKA